VVLDFYVSSWLFMSLYVLKVEFGVIFRLPAVLVWFRAICDLLRPRLRICGIPVVVGLHLVAWDLLCAKVMVVCGYRVIPVFSGRL